MPTGLGDEQLWLSATNDNTGTSTAFNDQSGNGNNGTASGTLVVTDTSEGGTYAYDFDGTDDYIDTSNVLGLGSGDFSISFWVKSSSSSQGTLLSTYNATNGKWISTEFNGDVNGGTDVGKVRAGIDDNTTKKLTNTYTASYNDGAWRHFVVERNNADGKLRVRHEGISVSSVAIGTYGDVTSTVPLRIGSNNTVSSGFFDGVMDDIRVFDRVLTQAEITHLASSRGVEGPPPVGLGDEQLWLCPSLNDSPNDISGNNNNGVYQNGMGTVADTAEGGSLAYDLNGTTQYITLGSVLTGTGDFTISGWFNTDSTSYSYIYGKGVSSPASDGIGIAQQANTVYGAIGDSSGRAVLAAAGTTAISTWYHYAVTFDRDGVATKYLNGVQIGTDSISSRSGDIGTDTDYVGRFGNVSGGFFDGKLDDIRAYNRVLTQAEITHLASSRGVLGAPALPEGLGDEQLWLCPSIQDSANDLSGNGNNGTYVGGMGTVTSDGKLCYDFDGADDYIDGSLSTALGSSVSSSCWIKFDAAPTATETFISNDGFATDGWLVQRLATTPAKLRYAEDASASTFCDNSYLNSTDWRHIVSVRDGSTVSLYIDGVQLAVTNSSITGAIAKTAFNIGRRLDSASQYSACVMDDIRLYDRALTQAEITHLASSRGVEGPPPVGLGDEQLWLCPSLNDSANDISGSGNNGTYVGGMGTVADVSNGGSRCYSFDGTNDYISNSSLDLRNLPAMSWSAWVLDYKTSGVSSFFSHGISGVFTNDTIFYQSSGNNSFQINQSADGGGYTSKPTAGTWHHLVCVFDGSGATDSDRLRYFLDGVEVGLVYNYTVPALTGNPSSSSTMIGNYVCAPTNFFPGKQDDIRVYTRVLTQAEITHLATSRGIEGSPSTPTTQYNAFVTHAFRQLFQTRLR